MASPQSSQVRVPVMTPLLPGGGLSPSQEEEYPPLFSFKSWPLFGKIPLHQIALQLASLCASLLSLDGTIIGPEKGDKSGR